MPVAVTVTGEAALKSRGLVEMKSAQEALLNANAENEGKYGVITRAGRAALEQMDKIDAERNAPPVPAAANEEQPTDQMSLFERGWP